MFSNLPEIPFKIVTLALTFNDLVSISNNGDIQKLGFLFSIYVLENHTVEFVFESNKII